MGDYFLVTGGADWSVPERSLNTVVKYSRSGFVEFLPAFNQSRHNHACSSFVSDSGKTVGFLVLYMKILEVII